ncbi:MAG: type II toxin-antitoxin system VapC family toxin [Bryobacteraceae bacterium]
MLSGNNRFDTVVLDSSIVFAILLQEADFEQYVGILNDTRELVIGAPTLAEVGIVLQRREGQAGIIALLALIQRWRVRVIEFTQLHAMEAIEAYSRFGKGHHPARLNLGDCNSYATAKVAGAALLYKGNDFALTDLPKLTPTA